MSKVFRPRVKGTEMTNCDTEKRCKECGEIRYDEEGNLDSRIQAGMKCTICAY